VKTSQQTVVTSGVGLSGVSNWWKGIQQCRSADRTYCDCGVLASITTLSVFAEATLSTLRSHTTSQTSGTHRLYSKRDDIVNDFCILQT